MQDEAPAHAHIQRCTYQEIRGRGAWQCLETDPHPSGRGHRFPIDAEFGRVLDEQRPDWLAAQLRDKTALTHHLQKRLDDLQAIAIDLATGWAGGTGVRPATAEWVAANAPTAAALLGWDA